MVCYFEEIKSNALSTSQAQIEQFWENEDYFAFQVDPYLNIDGTNSMTLEICQNQSDPGKIRAFFEVRIFSQRISLRFSFWPRPCAQG